MCIKVSSRLTVYFEESFWVGVFEERMDEQISSCKVIFGSEPKDCEVYDFVLKKYSRLKFSKSVQDEAYRERKINPKRLQRIIKKQTSENGIGTKAQQALKAEYEANKLTRKNVTKEKKERLKEEKYKKKQEKKKLKKRGH